MGIDSWFQSRYLIDNLQITAEQKAIHTWNVILDENTQVINFKNSKGVAVGNQTVRIDSDNRPTESKSAAGAAPRRKVIITGVLDHPTIPDTDIQEGYYFNLSNDPGDRITVQDVIRGEGEIQAIGEASR